MQKQLTFMITNTPIQPNFNITIFFNPSHSIMSPVRHRKAPYESLYIQPLQVYTLLFQPKLIIYIYIKLISFYIKKKIKRVTKAFKYLIRHTSIGFNDICSIVEFFMIHINGYFLYCFHMLSSRSDINYLDSVDQ